MAGERRRDDMVGLLGFATAQGIPEVEEEPRLAGMHPTLFFFLHKKVPKDLTLH